MTVLEGLGYSDIPCATPLSVAGLYGFMTLFPLGRGFILRGKACRITAGFEQFSHS